MSKTTNNQMATGIFILLTFLFLAALGINWYVDREQQRDLQRWESRLAFIADSRIASIEQWLTTQFSALNELANNPSLQLYLWQTTQGSKQNTTPKPAQLRFLRNLIWASAEREGFVSIPSKIPANITRKRATGIALIDTNLNFVTATEGMPALTELDKQTIEAAINGRPNQLGPLRLDGADNSVILFAVPVLPVLGAEPDTQKKPIGAVIGLRNANQDLFPLLRQGASFAEENEALILTQQENRIHYLSPTRDGIRPGKKQLPFSKQNLAASTAFSDSMDIGPYTNYMGNDVLTTSRPFKMAPWKIQQQVNAKQALRESNDHRNFLFITLSLALLSIAALTIAAWRHGSSVKALQQNEALKGKTEQLQKQSSLLHAITDNIDSQTLLISNQGKILFANEAIADSLGIELQNLRGSYFNAVFDQASRQKIEAAEKSTGSNIIELQVGKKTGVYQTTLLPIKKLGKHYNPLLLVLNDVTQLHRSQQKQELMLRDLVSTLVHVVDLHDPYSAYHSIHMAEVANAIGEALQLNSADMKTLDLAATLANLGKIMIPKEVLTKTEPLTEAEHDLLQKHVQYGLELLENLNFDGPVTQTIAQKQEHLDGSGYPNHLSGERMSLTGKILSVANAFVALASPRAYREGLSITDSVDLLMEKTGAHYDRQVVAALFHIVENRKDWSQWRNEGMT
ncbi:MAG: HD domain-containing phosphohydrolase [Gammaproteobacteria bacterium]